MIEINKTTIGIAAGVAGTLFLGYCIYFDNKRRADPEYKKKVRERRQHSRKNVNSPHGGMPNMNDHEAIERYFLQEIQLGETLIARGEYESGVEHLANAIVVCGQPSRLLQVLQTSLPAQVFAMLILKMQDFSSRAAASEDAARAAGGTPLGSASAGGPTVMSLDGTINSVVMDDLE